MDIVNRIIEIMEEKGLNGVQLGELLGKKKSPVTDWKNGKSKPTLEQIAIICEKLAISPDFLIFGNGCSNSQLTEDAFLFLRKYHLLDARGQTMVKAALYTEMDRMERNELLLSSQRPQKVCTDAESMSPPKEPPLALKIRKPLGSPSGYDSQLKQALR